MSGQFKETRTHEDELLGRPVGGILLVCPCGNCWRDWDQCDQAVPDADAMLWWVVDDSRRCFIPHELLPDPPKETP
jgi:hypothetical protein